MKCKYLALAALTCSLLSATTHAAERPNFLIIIADDLGYSDLGSYGSEIETPHLDALASEGLRMTNFHTAPTCSPTRSMLLSGTDSHIAGVGNMAELMQPFQKDKPGYEGYLNQRVANLGEVLQDAGYSTYTTGKWHLGRTEELSPAQRGFNHSYILVQGGASHFDDMTAIISVDPKAIYREDGKQVEVPKGFFSSEFYTDKMIDYIDKDRASGKPFFGLLSYTAPHWPLHAPDEWLEKYEGRYAEGYEAVRQKRLAKMKDLELVAADVTPHVPMQGTLPSWDQLTDEQKKREARSMEVYAAMVDNMDHHIGRLFDYLKESGQYDNTFILFLSDNGADGNSPLGLPGNDVWMNEAFDNSPANMGRRGSYIDYGAQWAQVGSTPFPYFKGLTTQGGVQVPAIIKHASVKKPGTINREIMHVMDIMPTFLQLAGVEHPAPEFKGRTVEPMQGLSIIPALQGEALPERAIGWELFGRKGLRKGDLKLTWMTAPYGTGEWQLFNLANDPTESKDLSASQPEKLAELLKDWDAYAKRNNVLEGEFNIRYGFETCLFDRCFK